MKITLENVKKWKPLMDEIVITYPKEQHGFYKQKNKECSYDQHQRQVGINKGIFVEMVAAKYYQDQGYCVESFYYLVRNRKKREGMSGFKKILETFGDIPVRKCIAEADAKFLSYGKRSAAGDPDLFVYNDASPKDCFFVEVKANDKIRANQHILFPIIEKHLCPVYIVRVKQSCP
jgi:hypothetical protein